ncbi:AroB-related putative sugar phosphate phospholyase (cyclizing) [uncultured Subdoligranulum sp.]|uniref:AroB-related putative sugar phosphate phospholyase (cyclizing) n=1 Tax=uncultured Subdoligranulum sp. TaxID=512298 RepID=UPI002634DD61|nr:AroB-related putative sugar phosphate phospholyase (cyclizing) [uncultured Subdoligranulum sp.]
MIIKSSTKDYEVNIVRDFSFVEQLLQRENAMFVIDKTVYNLYHDRLFANIPENRLMLLEALEPNKTIDTALKICEVMTEIPAKRNAWLVSFGGGITQDVTGFAANILYRGVHWAFVPTTLLAACDSCIGGKTSLNYKQYKNLLGTFFAPDEIYICPEFFKTLTEKDFESGLGEVVKFNVMFGEEGITHIENCIDRLLERDPQELNTCVEKSLQFKKRFIEEDEFDRGVRIHLNFAHTFGHAFEVASNYEFPHGTAVAMGTIAANRVSVRRGWLAPELAARMERVLQKIIHVDKRLTEADMGTIMAAIRKDKKQVGTDLTAVLFDREMNLQIVHDMKPEEVEDAVLYLFEKI